MSKNFNEKLKQYLCETPWYDLQFEIPIDLQFELAKSKEDLLKKLEDAFLDSSNRLYIKDNFVKFKTATLYDNIFQSFVKKYNCKEEVTHFFNSTLQKLR